MKVNCHTWLLLSIVLLLFVAVDGQEQKQASVKYIIKTIGPISTPDIGMNGISLYNNELIVSDSLNRTIRIFSLESESFSPNKIGNNTSIYTPDGNQNTICMSTVADSSIFNDTLFYVDR